MSKISNAERLRKAENARWNNLRIERYKEDEFDVLCDLVRYNLSIRDASWMLWQHIKGDNELHKCMLLALLTALSCDHGNELQDYDSFTSGWKKLQARVDSTDGIA
jgi:hypothetical protein